MAQPRASSRQCQSPQSMSLFWRWRFGRAVIGVADYFVFGTTARQFLARDFASTTGEIVESHVTQLALLRAGITIHYSYTVRAGSIEAPATVTTTSFPPSAQRMW